MKIRNGFVSNSSSSSFIINKKDITEKQFDNIKNHLKYSQKMEFESAKYSGKSDEWGIRDEGENIVGETYMDNFDMCSFLKDIGVEGKSIKWDDY